MIDKQKEWKKKNGFNAEDVTYVVIGESYSIKNELKDAGFIFNPILKWHRDTNEGYEDKTIKVNLNDVVEFSSNGEGVYKSTAKNFISNIINPYKSQVETFYYGEIGQKLDDIEVILKSKRDYMGNWGQSYIYTFEDNNSHIFIWFTTKIIEFNINDELYLRGTIKSHNEYNNQKQTIITRCKLIRRD